MGNKNLSAFYSSVQSGEELANLQELELPEDELVIRDKREQIKLKFPFTRMDIKAFEYKLDEICSSHILGFLNNSEV